MVNKYNYELKFLWNKKNMFSVKEIKPEELNNGAFDDKVHVRFNDFSKQILKRCN